MKADLVLEGGGIKGIGLAGAVAALEEAGYEFPRIAGTSAGALAGALVAVGYTADEIETLLRTVDQRQFADEGLLDRLGLPGKALSVLLDDPCVVRRTIFVDTFGVRATDFEIDTATKARLYENGRHAAGRFLDRWDFDRYVEECRD